MTVATFQVAEGQSPEEAQLATDWIEQCPRSKQLLVEFIPHLPGEGC